MALSALSFLGGSALGVSEGHVRFTPIAETTLRLSGAIPRGAGMLDYTGLDRSHLRRSCPFHHALIIPHSLALLHI